MRHGPIWRTMKDLAHALLGKPEKKASFEDHGPETEMIHLANQIVMSFIDNLDIYNYIYYIILYYMNELIFLCLTAYLFI
jgi:hypothetical protein